MRKQSVGEQELQILKYVTDNNPISVGETASYFAEAKNLARTTVLTVMERLRKKGYLKREKVENTYLYSPCKEKSALLKDLVKDFTESILSGSFDPFIAYLSTDAKLTDQQIQDLKQIVEKMETRGNEDAK